MERTYFFIGLIASVSLIHLTTVAVQAMRGLSEDRSANDNLANRPATRDDWYVFFHCADLWGSQTPHGAAGRAKQAGADAAAKQVKIQRPQSRARL